MRRRDQPQAALLDSQLTDFDRDEAPLVGIRRADRKACLIEQLVESRRRVQFVATIGVRPVDPLRAQPSSDLFDPIKAAHIHHVSGDIDEACWMIFLATHFGKHRVDKWQLARDIYGALDYSSMWTWTSVSADPSKFRSWLRKNESKIRSSSKKRRFGNHRKYESLSATSSVGTAAVVESYINWIRQQTDHAGVISHAAVSNSNDPKKMFSFLFESMSEILRFGRTAKFDYLSFLGNLGIANIRADKAYLAGATGPLKGARLMFGGSTSSKLSPRLLESSLSRLDSKIGLGMQVMEDALCNWQKSPSRFSPFRG